MERALITKAKQLSTAFSQEGISTEDLTEPSTRTFIRFVHQTVFHMNPKTNGDFTEP
ncbi:MAG: hypothetical protein ABSG57_02860 [Candidatus Bathyarchaeia archaeon]